jgi:hypothetical protein
MTPEPPLSWLGPVPKTPPSHALARPFDLLNLRWINLLRGCALLRSQSHGEGTSLSWLGLAQAPWP